MNRRWNVLVKRLLDTTTSHVGTLMPDCEIRLEATSTEGNGVKVIKIHYTPRFHEDDERAEPVVSGESPPDPQINL